MNDANPNPDIFAWRPTDLNEAVWEALVHRLWHATTIPGLKGILDDGCIRVITENVGSKYRVAPLMHSCGCVSLFDFGPTAGPAWLLQAQYRNWAGWLTGEYGDRAMIWLELDRDLTAANVIPAGRVRELHQAQLSAKVISGVEAGHRGSVPLGSIRGALVFYSRTGFERHDNVNEGLLARAEQLGDLHWVPNTYIEAWKRARNRNRGS